MALSSGHSSLQTPGLRFCVSEVASLAPVPRPSATGPGQLQVLAQPTVTE